MACVMSVSAAPHPYAHRGVAASWCRTPRPDDPPSPPFEQFDWQRAIANRGEIRDSASATPCVRALSTGAGLTKSRLPGHRRRHTCGPASPPRDSVMIGTAWPVGFLRCPGSAGSACVITQCFSELGFAGCPSKRRAHSGAESTGSGLRSPRTAEIEYAMAYDPGCAPAIRTGYCVLL